MGTVAVVLAVTVIVDEPQVFSQSVQIDDGVIYLLFRQFLIKIRPGFGAERVQFERNPFYFKGDTVFS